MTKNEHTSNYKSIKLENLHKQLSIGKCIDVLMAQSFKLMDIVIANQKEINQLKIEQDQLKKEDDAELKIN